MRSIDERIVAMAFENAKFEANVAVTMATLGKLNDSLQKIGQANSFADIEKAAAKVTLEQPVSALDKLRARLAGASQGAAEGMGAIEQASNKVTLEAPLTALDRVQSKVGQVGANASTGFNGIESAANRVDLAGLTRALDSVVAKFSVLEGAAAVALGNIAAQAAMRGAAFAKSFALGPIQAGLSEYTTNLNSIQTILANTASSGGNLKTVNAALDELNHYSDKTIYNFGEMAKNVGTFTAAGVNLDTATASIKGIANLAALSGSNSQQASTAMYQLSQAIAAGKVNLQDWNSVVNAGMGGAVFQKALFTTGKAMGTITNSPVGQTFEEWTKAGNSFRQSLSASQKAAEDGSAKLAKAQKDSTEAIKDAQESAAEANENAAERVKDAQESAAEANENAAERVKEAQESAAEANENAAERVKEAHRAAAEQVAASAERVKEAQRGVSEAAEQAATDLQEAEAAQTAAFQRGADDVQAALDGVTEARKRLDEALKPPSEDELQAATDNLKTAQMDQADLATAVTDAQREQTRSVEDLGTAQQRLSDLQKNGGSESEIRSATRAVEDAQTRVTDSADAVERAIIRQNTATRDLHEAETNLTETQKKGTEQDQKVIDSREALTGATQKYQTAQTQAQKDIIAAQTHVTEVTLKGQAAQKESVKKLAKAERTHSRTIIDSREKVAEAEKAQATTIIESREKVAEAEAAQAKTIIDSREKIAEAEKAQAKTLIDSREKVADAEEAAAERIKTARESMDSGQGNGPPSWLTSDVLTNTLKQFTGDLTTAQLKAQGLTDAQIKSIQQTSKLAQDAAQKVKTLGQVFDIARETLGSGWSATFRTIFGNFTEARTTFTSLSNTINGFINTNADARNKVLKDWKALGGRTVLIEGIKNAFHALMAVIKPIGDAFRDIFPRQTGQNLFEMTKKFEEFTEKLKPSAETVENLRRTFRGLFAVLHIVWTVVKDVIGVIVDLLGVAGEGSGGFLGFTGSIGDLLVALDKALTKGGLLKTFFDTISTILQVPIRLFGELAKIIFGLFGGSDDDAKASALSGSLDKVGKAAGPLTPILNSLKSAWDGFLRVLEQAKDLAAPWLSNIGDLVSNLGDTLASALGNIDFNKTMGVLQTGFIGGIFLVLRKAIKGGSGGLTDVLGGLKDVFAGLTDNLEAMQRKVKAQAILLIAGAIGVLAASTFVLSTIDPKRLASALTAMAVGLGELMGAMKLMTSGLGMTGILTLPVLAAGLIGVATATVIIAGAMKIFATMKWEDIAKGLVGVGGGLAAIGVGMKFLSGPTLLAQGPALILIGVALNILALAVKQFSSMKWEDMVKGIAGVLGTLVALAVPLSAMGPSLILVGPGLIAAAIAMNILARAVKAFGDMDARQMVGGILGLMGAIAGLGIAIMLIPPTVALQAAGLVILSVALMGIAGAVATMGSLNIKTIVKGLVGIGGALAILAVGLSAMSGTIAGSVALLAASAALALLAPTLGFMGTLNWGTIFKGLAAMALVLGTLAVVGTVASSGLISLGISLLPLAGVFLVTAGALFIFAKALALLGEGGAKGIGVMVAAITAFLTLLPSLVISFVKGLVDILDALADVLPKVVTSLGAILDTIIAFVIASAPKLAVAIGTLVDTFLQVLLENTPKIIAAGYKLLLDFLGGLDNNIEEVVTRATSVIVKFLETLAENAPKLTQAGVQVLVQMMDGIASQLGALATSAVNLVTRFISAVVGQLPKILLMGAEMVAKLVTGILGKVSDVANAGLRMIISIITGIGDALPKVVKAAGDVVKKFINAVAEVGPDLVDAGFKALIKFLHGIATAIRENNQDLVDAGVDIASAILEGLVNGLGAIGSRLVKPAVEKLFGMLPGWARKVLGINSPSKVFMEIGKFTAQGMVVGLRNTTGEVASAAENMGDQAVVSLQKSMGRMGDVMSLVDVDKQPTITPVLDLTHIRKGAAEISGLSSTLTAGASFAIASSISSEKQSADEAQAAEAPSRVFNFEQNNYSPEALSDIEIYRQTKNQLSQVKDALGLGQ